MTKQHLFEVWRDGVCLFWTDDPRCIPDAETQRSMRRSGCRIKQRKD